MGKKILLADDSITIQKVIELTFSDEDFDVITVGNGRLALEKLLEVRPDIVLCDIIMPEKDGYEVCEQIKSNPGTSHIPVLLLTGAFEPFDQDRAARSGYDGSLAKPFEPETLIAKVKELLARAPARAQAPPVLRPAPAPVLPPVLSPPAVLPFQRPAPAVPAPPPRFIPDEPFGGFEGSAFGEPAEAATPSADTYAPMTEEESATLLAPPPPEPAPADAASTVMFRAGELPWNAQPVPTPPETPLPAARESTPAAAPVRESERAFVAEPANTPEVIEEPAVFEEVMEEDLDFGAQGFEPQVEPMLDDASSAIPMPAGVGTLPPIAPEDDGAVTGTFEPLRDPPPPIVTAKPGPAFEPVPMPAFEPEPVPIFEPELPPAFEPEPPPGFEPEPTPVFQPAPAPAFRPEPRPAFQPEPEQVFEPEPERLFEPEPERVFEPEPTAAFERGAEQVFEPEPTAAFERGPEQVFEPAPAFERFVDRVSPTPKPAVAAPAPPADVPILAPESFADVAQAVVAPTPPVSLPSEAAAVSVPVDMVEKIAQRVVAQISEKAVREIAWEVIPDLAEALIKREIERLKAELQKI